MAECMGFERPEWGDTGGVGTLKRKFRWLFSIENITVGSQTALPCIKAARPKLNFREMQAEHLNETISYPSKPEWQPIPISLYDRCIATQNPIFTWLRQQYDPTPERPGCSAWFPCIDDLSFKPCCNLQLLDGCGNMLEAWTLEHCYPQNIDWGDLDMSSMEVVTCDFTLRYDRAFQTFPAMPHDLYEKTKCASCTDPMDCMPSTTSMAITAMLMQAAAGITTDYKNIDISSPDFIMIF